MILNTGAIADQLGSAGSAGSDGSAGSAGSVWLCLAQGTRLTANSPRLCAGEYWYGAKCSKGGEQLGFAIRGVEMQAVSLQETLSCLESKGEEGRPLDEIMRAMTGGDAIELQEGRKVLSHDGDGAY